MEGVGCVLAGMWGSGSGTTSYSENIGALGITKVSYNMLLSWSRPPDPLRFKAKGNCDYCNRFRLAVEQ